ncbi:MAG: hypothetical protein AAGA65_00380 [Actinomycetota bacterium]
MTWRTYTNPITPLRGRSLRFMLVDHIRRRGTMTVAEMVTALAAEGHNIPGRPSKVISDALRWEIARGRVKRIGRGVYCAGRTPRTTARRIHLLAARSRAWLAATTRDLAPPPTPDTRHDRWGHLCYANPCTKQHEDPGRPPWQNLNWLWST